MEQTERLYLREALGELRTRTAIPYPQDEGVKETEGKLSQEQVALMTAVRSGDSGDRGASGCDASKRAQIHSSTVERS